MKVLHRMSQFGKYRMISSVSLSNSGFPEICMDRRLDFLPVCFNPYFEFRSRAMRSFMRSARSIALRFVVAQIRQTGQGWWQVFMESLKICLSEGPA